MATMKAHTRKPEIFTGDRKKLEGFIRDCDIYVAANTADFTTNNLKTQFILSHIGGGEAESWKEHYYNTVVTPIPGTFTWEAPADLIANLRQNFAREDDVEESLRKLEAMKQGRKAIQYDQIYRDARAAQREDRGNNYKSNDNKNRNLRQAFQKGNERTWRSSNNNFETRPLQRPERHGYRLSSTPPSTP
jgi:hypothetical protein